MADWQAHDGLMQAVDEFMYGVAPLADNLATQIAAAYEGEPLPDLLNSVMAYLAYVELYSAASMTHAEPHIRLQVAFQDVISLPFVQQLASKAIGGE